MINDKSIAANKTKVWKDLVKKNTFAKQLNEMTNDEVVVKINSVRSYFKDPLSVLSKNETVTIGNPESPTVLHIRSIVLRNIESLIKNKNVDKTLQSIVTKPIHVDDSGNTRKVLLPNYDVESYINGSPELKSIGVDSLENLYVTFFYSIILDDKEKMNNRVSSIIEKNSKGSFIDIDKDNISKKTVYFFQTPDSMKFYKPNDRDELLFKNLVMSRENLYYITEINGQQKTLIVNLDSKGSIIKDGINREFWNAFIIDKTEQITKELKFIEDKMTKYYLGKRSGIGDEDSEVDIDVEQEIYDGISSSLFNNICLDIMTEKTVIKDKRGDVQDVIQQLNSIRIKNVNSKDRNLNPDHLIKDMICTNFSKNSKDVSLFSNDMESIALTKINFNIGSKSEVTELPDEHKKFFDGKCSEEHLDRLAYFVCSVLDAKNFSRQTLYLTNEGGSGTSTFINYLKRLFNSRSTAEICASIGESAIEKLNSVTNIINKRLITITDINDPYKFLNSDFFRNITGGDTIHLDVKYQNPIEWDTNGTKMIVSTNVYNTHISSYATASRLLHVNFEKNYDMRSKMDTNVLQNKLFSEGQKFIEWCKYRYQTLLDNENLDLHYTISSNDHEFKVSKSQFTNDYKNLLYKDLSKKYKTSSATSSTSYFHIKETDLQNRILSSGYLEDVENLINTVFVISETKRDEYLTFTKLQNHISNYVKETDNLDILGSVFEWDGYNKKVKFNLKRKGFFDVLVDLDNGKGGNDQLSVEITARSDGKYFIKNLIPRPIKDIETNQEETVDKFFSGMKTGEVTTFTKVPKEIIYE